DRVPCRRAPLDRRGRVRAGGRNRDHPRDARRNSGARRLEPGFPEGGAGGMSRVAVVGAGTMGNGIAHVFAQHGWDTALIDVAPGLLERVLAVIRTNLERQVKKGSVTAEQRVVVLVRFRHYMDFDS